MPAFPVSSIESSRPPVSAPLGLFKALTDRWQGLADRDKMWIRVAMAVVAAAVLWWAGLAPAVKVLTTAPAQRAALGVQLQQMQNLQAQANALQALPKIKSGDAARALEALVRQRFGASAQMSVAGSQATLTLTNVPADALAQFFAEARAQANALPSQARLRRSANAQAWDGTLVLLMPAL